MVVDWLGGKISYIKYNPFVTALFYRHFHMFIAITVLYICEKTTILMKKNEFFHDFALTKSSK